MPAWLLLVLENVLPLLLADLVKAGAINEAQRIGTMALVETEEFLGSLSAYYQFPGDSSGPTNTSNILVGQPPT